MDWMRLERENCRALEGVVTCERPLRPDLQCINLYAPEAYFAGGKVCGYARETAPIVLRNCVGGYSEATPEKLDDFGRECLANGFVYVTAGARGKQTVDENGRFIGKAPLGLVDIKAAVRFLKHFAAELPGDTNRIVSTGVSAGGAMSSLLGCTGNAVEYEGMLRDCGAYTDVGDDIFAAQCYCPIIDLHHADAAYEWMFKGVKQYNGFAGRGGLDGFAQALSAQLCGIYIEYFNALGAQHPVTGEPLLLGADGRSGSAYDCLMEVVRAAAQADGSAWIPQALDDLYQGYVERLKECPSFDALGYHNPETQVFGDETTDYVHFSPDVARAIDAVKDDFPQEYARHYAAYALSKWDGALHTRRDLLDPFQFIGTDKQGGTAPHYRIRVGTQDPHTSFTMAMLLAVKLKNAGHPDTDYAMVWDRDHCAADTEGAFAQWVRGIV